MRPSGLCVEDYFDYFDSNFRVQWSICNHKLPDKLSKYQFGVFTGMSSHETIFTDFFFCLPFFFAMAIQAKSKVDGGPKTLRLHIPNKDPSPHSNATNSQELPPQVTQANSFLLWL